MDSPDMMVGLTSSARGVPMTDALAGGRLELQSFALHGVPLSGAFEVTRDGTTVLVSRRPIGPPQLRPADARIDAAALGSAIAAALGTDRAPTPESPPVLVYRLVLGEPVLAWEVQLPLTIRPEPSRRTLWISADSGELVDERENVFASRARVFAENPSATPTPIEVVLDEIDVDGPGMPLVGTRLRSLNCVTTRPAVVESWHEDGECWSAPRTFSDLNGDFFVPLPDVIVPADNVDGDDLYAELAMYVHGERFLAFMAERGLTQYRCELSTMLANFRGVEPDNGRPYDPLDNAYFTDQCDPSRGPTMLFGQGTEVDFAFDADVIYHELGHGTVALLAPLGLNQLSLRSDGVTPDASAINEALADYIAAMITGDPVLAEYVGRFWTAQDVPYIRSAENDARCPDDVIGESHADGEPLMAALWSTRLRTGEVLDDIVFRALGRLPPDATLEQAAAALVGVAHGMRDEGRIDDEGVAVLERELATRGLDDCPRVIGDPEQLADGITMYLRKTSSSVEPFWPGPMQLRHEVPQDRDRMTVSVELTPRGSSDPTSASLLVKRGDTPIAYTYSLVARDADGDPSGASKKVRELTLVEGDWDEIVPLTRVADAVHEAEIDGLHPGEVVHVALVATAPVDALVSRLRVLAPVPSEDTSSSDDDGDGGGDREQRVGGADSTASCACDVRGSDPSVLLALALLRRRRSRR
ncbi:MAG TPA: hypothetical protein VG755_22325 [Nannocystaceae bacterium]|nr:hypothetical protein [Nannocystaceae bacterium]